MLMVIFRYYIFDITSRYHYHFHFHFRHVIIICIYHHYISFSFSARFTISRRQTCLSVYKRQAKSERRREYARARHEKTHGFAKATLSHIVPSLRQHLYHPHVLRMPMFVCRRHARYADSDKNIFVVTPFVVVADVTILRHAELMSTYARAEEMNMSRSIINY